MLDLTVREKAVFAPLLLLVLWMGVYPISFLAPISTSVDNLVQRAAAAQKAAQRAELRQPLATSVQAGDQRPTVPTPSSEQVWSRLWIPAFAGVTKPE
jgi:hypothetical protein